VEGNATTSREFALGVSGVRTSGRTQGEGCWRRIYPTDRLSRMPSRNAAAAPSNHSIRHN
jgi:hypothetical protein